MGGYDCSIWHSRDMEALREVYMTLIAIVRPCKSRTRWLNTQG